MVIAIYNCLWTPLTISFDYAMEQEKTNKLIRVLDFTFMGFYTIDIVIQFLTSFINVETGDEITKPSLIANRYFWGEFPIDFMSTFPFRYFLLEDQSF